MAPPPRRLSLLAASALALCGTTTALVASSPPSTTTETTRRAFCRIAVATTAGVWTAQQHVVGCTCGSCASSANAFERRDVGGDGASPETKAMNEQAYQTQSRLEKAGLRMETAEEQSASLTAALSGYSYSDSSSSSSKK